jgi:hypothetical protein
MKKYLLSLLCLLFVNFLTADSWVDPSWKKMLKRADLIALVEYISEGDFRAKAKILKVYKGSADTDTIWISGFSNRYGPIDTMKPGFRFIVFLNKASAFDKDDEEYWMRRVKEEPEMRPYAQALKKGIVYYVQTPTSGDLRVVKNRVQYDLLSSSFYKSQRFQDLKWFEAFLHAYSNPNQEFYEKTLQRLDKYIDTKLTPQLLMMLYLTSYDRYQDIFEEIRKKNTPKAQFALAKLAYNIKDMAGQDLLIRLLDSEHSLVQGEVVRQLSELKADFIGPILLKKLSDAGDEGVYPQDIMDPVQNSLDGGKIEIIKTLGKLKYKPAIPKLLPLLKTEDEFLFMTTFKTLQQLESTEYVPYINAHLEGGKVDFMYKLGRIITDNKLTECIPSLMKFTATQDKSDFNSDTFCISFYLGLGSFDLPEIRTFLAEDFEKLVPIERGGMDDYTYRWIEEYFETFTHLKMTSVKSSVYNIMFKYVGFNESFKKDASLFAKKQQAEQQLEKVLANMLQEANIDFDKINIDVLFDFATAVDLKSIPAVVNVELKAIGETVENLGKILTKRFKEEQYTQLHLSISTGNFTQLFSDFTQGRTEVLMRNFIKYLVKNPDAEDIVFLQNLYDFGYYDSEYDKKRLVKKIAEAKTNLKKN